MTQFRVALNDTTKVRTKDEIQSMRVGGKMLAQVLQMLKNQTEAGMSTKMLSDMSVAELQKLGGKPTILGYEGFPEALCVSINDEVVHGIPRKDRIIRLGDIVSVDFCVSYQGMITDAALSFIVGTPRNFS